MICYPIERVKEILEQNNFWKLLEKIHNETIESKIQVEDNPPLYHYTSASGLKGMLENKSLWCTNIDYLNDPNEFKYGHDIATRAFQRIIGSNDDDMPPDGKMFSEEEPPPIFSFSFSLQDDLLSQWRGYGDDGCGFSIEFEYLECEDIDFIQTGSRPKVIDGKVLYDEDEQEGLWDTFFKTANDSIHSIISNIKGQCELNEDKLLRPMAYHGIFQYVHSLLPLIKAHGFHEEKEVRYCFSSFSWEPNTFETKVRERNNKLIPYIEIKHNKGKLPITKIICGPKNDFKKTEFAIKHLLKQHGYPDSIKVVPSKMALTD